MALPARRCLLVEDDVAIADMYAIKLRIDGWEVWRATTGEAALDRVAEVLPGVVLLDIMLPGIDGFEVLERLRAAPGTRGLPVVIVSNSQATPARRDRARALGALDWLVKSNTSPGELATRLSKVMVEGR